MSRAEFQLIRMAVGLLRANAVNITATITMAFGLNSGTNEEVSEDGLRGGREMQQQI